MNTRQAMEIIAAAHDDRVRELLRSGDWPGATQALKEADAAREAAAKLPVNPDHADLHFVPELGGAA